VPRKKEEIQKRLAGFDTQRNFIVDKSAINEETRTISFILISEENEGERYDWWNDETFIEKLDVNGARYDRLKTFFKDHNRLTDSAIGRVINIRVENGKLKADVVFGTDEDSEKIFRKYVDGILTDCSIGYKIISVTTEERKGEPTLVTVTEFEIRELSAVGIGFDKGATVGRNLNKGDDSMNETLRKELESLRAAVDGLTAEQKTRMDELTRLEDEAKRAATDNDLVQNVNNETQRTADIMCLVVAGQLTNERGLEFIQNKSSIDSVRKAILDERVQSSNPVVVVGGIPGVADMQRAIEDSILLRCGLDIVDTHKDVNMFRGASMVEIARHLTGASGYDKNDIAQRAMSNDQFTLLLGNVANRVVTDSFEKQEGTYGLWTRNVDLPDFRVRNEVGLVNPNGRLRKLGGERGEAKNIEFDENGEAWKLESYGEKFFLTRQMIVNDDLGVFTSIVNEFGSMAKRTANGLVYDLLQKKGDFTNYKMADNKAIFEAGTHKNISATGGAISTDTLSAGRTSMRRQMNGKEQLNIAPKFLLVSPENETLALQIMQSEADLSGGNSGVKNIFKNTLTAIIESELDSQAWYLAAARKTIKTGTLAGTNGMPIVRQNNSSLSGTEFECVFDFGLVCEDFRGLYKNLGA
jgi:hypothetical protein